MFTPILLALLISASPGDEASASPAPTEPLKVSIGNMSFSGDTIKLTKSDIGAIECAIDGSARLAVGSAGDSDIAITAQNIVIARNANSEITIHCTGDCRFADSEHTCSADRMQIQLSNHFKLQLSGGCRVQYGAGDDRTTLVAESITFHDGTFSVSGAASLKRAQ